MPPIVQAKAMVGFLTKMYTRRDSSLCKTFPKENPSGVVLMPSFVVHIQLLSRLLQVSLLTFGF